MDEKKTALDGADEKPNPLFGFLCLVGVTALTVPMLYFAFNIGPSSEAKMAAIEAEASLKKAEAKFEEVNARLAREEKIRQKRSLKVLAEIAAKMERVGNKCLGRVIVSTGELDDRRLYDALLDRGLSPSEIETAVAQGQLWAENEIGFFMRPSKQSCAKAKKLYKEMADKIYATLN
jgi:hypothetical protein